MTPCNKYMIWNKFDRDSYKICKQLNHRILALLLCSFNILRLTSLADFLLTMVPANIYDIPGHYS